MKMKFNKGLSRMRGNFHVRFLGDGTWVTRFCYPMRVGPIIYAILLTLSMGAQASIKAEVFISFSMPETLLIETLRDASTLEIPVTLNGLYQNSMSETIKKITDLTKALPDSFPNLQIDPTAFERYGIHQVPALVLDNGACFDVVFGNLPLKDGLERIFDKSECRFFEGFKS